VFYMLTMPTILVIDDEKIMLDSCCEIFNTEGYKTIAAENGEKGLQKFKEANPDLILLDLKMPGMNGMAVLEEAIKTDPNCVVIVITGYATIESAVEAMKKGAYDFLPKPFTPDELRIVAKRGLERRKLTLETESLRKEKEKLQDNFITLVSHELRSPLAAVEQNIMVIVGGMVGEIPDKVQIMLKRVSERIKGLIKLINDWLNLSRIESGELVTEMEPVELKQILSDAVDLLNPLANERNVHFILNLPEKFPTILGGNKEALQMLFTNLIHNGIKYNYRGGHVKIILEDEDHKAKITVQDSGVGISKEKLPLVFEEFYRIKGQESVEGSGLGLSIVKKIVEAHSGQIEVESIEGKGTTFTVYLP